MQKVHFLILMLLGLSSPVISQTVSEIKNRFDVHIMPLSMIDPTPRLRLGAEYQVKDRFGYCLEVGLGNTSINKNKLRGTIHEDGYSFFEIRPEFKYYFVDKGTDNASLYCSAELYYISLSCRFTDSYYHLSNSNLVTFFDEANYSKVKYGGHIKGGVKHLFFKHVTADMYLGMGIAHRNIAYSGVTNPVSSEDYPMEEWFPHTEKYEGGRTIFHLTGGCKLGWTF